MNKLMAALSPDGVYTTSDPVSGQPIEVASIQYLETLFGSVVSVVLGLLGIAVFLMFVVGGFKYLTSGGDPKATESAQKTITYAIGGLVLAIVSYIIILFLEKLTGVNLTEFKVRI